MTLIEITGYSGSKSLINIDKIYAIHPSFVSGMRSKIDFGYDYELYATESPETLMALMRTAQALWRAS